MCHSVFHVWPKTPLFSVCLGDAKRLDTPARLSLKPFPALTTFL